MLLDVAAAPGGADLRGLARAAGDGRRRGLGGGRRTAWIRAGAVRWRVTLFDALPPAFLGATARVAERRARRRTASLSLPIVADGPCARRDAAGRRRAAGAHAARARRAHAALRGATTASSWRRRSRGCAAFAGSPCTSGSRRPACATRAAAARGAASRGCATTSSGDDPRYIDWKATARRGHPITREFTVEQSQTMYVLVDAGRSMTQLAGAYPRFEYALSSALVLADVAVRAGDRVGAMVFDDQLRVLVPAQRGTRRAARPAHGTRPGAAHARGARLRGGLPRAGAAAAEARARRAPHRRDRRARGAVAARTPVARRHRAISPSWWRCATKRSLAASALPAAGAGAARLYASAAAEELLAERATALQRMRDAGVVVLDVAPDAMAAAVVSQYLELKARGAL